MNSDEEKRQHRSFRLLFSLPDNKVSSEFGSNDNLHHNYSERSTNGILLIVHPSQDNSPLITLPFHIKIVLTIIMIISLLVGSYFKGIMYRFVYLTNKQNSGWMHRPINVLIINSAIIHHVTHILMCIWYSANLMSETPLADIVGFEICEAMDVVGVYGLGHLTVGGLGIVIYRMMYIKFEYVVRYIVGEKLLLFLMWSTNEALGVTLLLLFKFESTSDRFNLNMCRGISVADAQNLIDYRISLGEALLTTSYLQAIALAIVLAIQTMEFSIYVWFFRHRYKNDNVKMKKLLTHDVIRERNTKNIGTFLGQFYGFAMEYAFIMLILLLIMFADENTHHVKALANIAKMTEFGLLSAVEVYSSPGLRAFMKGKMSK